MEETNTRIVPHQQKGARKDIEHTVNAIDENDARKLFMIARNRLMNVNEWHRYTGRISATFKLTDASGKELNRTVEKNDFIKIDLPGPGSVEGKGFDWVKIEAIDDKSKPDGTDEHLALRVRPCSNPEEEGKNVAHFFSDDSTSSFIIERHGREVTAAVYGRNEIPNTETTNKADKVRNALVGATAIAGLSNFQWKNLIQGLIETKG
jgi:hypothetical protein